MGYTHYWTLKSKDPDLFRTAVNLFKVCLDLMPKTITTDVFDRKKGEWVRKRISNKLHGGNGLGKPTITDTTIRFNGNRKWGLDHETFRISLDDYNEGWVTDDGYIDDFCKTAEKPYDLAVCLCLLCFKAVYGDDFEYSSDGVTRESIKKPENLKYWKSIGWEPVIEDGWKKAYKIFDKVWV